MRVERGQSMSYVLGVDGGNSKTLAVVADGAGRVLGVGRSGGSNHQAPGGLPRAMEQVRRAAWRALGTAGVSTEEVAGTYYCLAGADLPEDFDLLQTALRDLSLGAQMGLNNDSVAILRSGTEGPNAVAVGWGSGITAVGRNAEGQEIRLPALGWISGDWGGGADLAHEAIWLVARAHDGRGEPTMLEDVVLQALKVPTVDEMIRKLYFDLESTLEPYREEASPEDVEEEEPYTVHLTPLVFQAANAGDRVARELVARSGAEVAITAAALLRRLGLIDLPADVVLGGSVFKAEGSLLLDTVRDRLAEAAPRARIVIPDVEPVVGVAFCAMDMLEIPVDRAVRERARRTYELVAGKAGAEVGA